MFEFSEFILFCFLCLRYYHYTDQKLLNCPLITLEMLKEVIENTQHLVVRRSDEKGLDLLHLAVDDLETLVRNFFLFGSIF